MGGGGEGVVLEAPDADCSIAVHIIGLHPVLRRHCCCTFLVGFVIGRTGGPWKGEVSRKEGLGLLGRSGTKIPSIHLAELRGQSLGFGVWGSGA